MPDEAKQIGFCYRCEYRAAFLETGHGPRCECKDTAMSVCGCYMYRPVLPVVMVPAHNETRPIFGPTMIAGRSRSLRVLTRDDVALTAGETEDGQYLYWAPKQSEERPSDDSAVRTV